MEAPMNRIVKLDKIEKEFYETCRMCKHVIWAKVNHHLKTGSLARSFPLSGLLGHIVGIFSDIINSRSPYVLILVQMTNYMLWLIALLVKQNLKLVKLTLINRIIDHNENILNMVTSDKGLILKSSVAINNNNIELCYDTISVNTLSKQRLALYLEQFTNRQNGGRIADQANATSKVVDSGYYIFSNIKHHSLPILGNRLNSVLLKPIHSNLTIRTLSYYTREEETFRKDKKLDNIVWPNKWQNIEEKVRKGQMKLCVLAEKYKGTNNREVLSYQRKLAVSLSFRLLAVKIVTTNKGKNTAGTDGKLINNDEEKISMVKNLKIWIMNPNKYQSKPVKRVYIPKKNNKLRPLGIPNIEDRCLQALLNLVLEPLVEMNSDTHSYGFRKFRSAKMALGALRVNLRNNEDHYDKFVLDADIEKFFDSISHEWLLEHIPLEITLKIILSKWLKSGAIYLNKFEPTLTGTPQGGIISPCLANFTLNGLQERIRQAVISKYRGFQNTTFSIKYKQKGKTKYKNQRLKIFTVRYADDFLVIGRSKRMIETAVIPAVEEFLSERGLKLSKEKTKVLSVRNSDKITFLGYCFQYQKKFSPKYNQFNDRLNKEGISCYPMKENYIKIVKELRDIFRKNMNNTAYTLITKLNPKIRGWANYFNMSQSYYLRNRLCYVLYRYVWLWAKRKHPRLGKKRIALCYFLMPKLLRNKYYTGNNKKWIFRGYTKRLSIYNESDKGKYIELVDPTIIVETISARRYRIPGTLETVHAYHPNYKALIELKESMALLSVKPRILKVELFKRQKGKCAMCKGRLLETEVVDYIGLNGEWDIDHIEPWGKGGSKSNKDNLRLVHRHCHISHHKDYTNI